MSPVLTTPSSLLTATTARRACLILLVAGAAAQLAACAGLTGGPRVVTVSERIVIETENRDREAVFEAVARAYGLGSSDVRSLFYEMQRGR